MGATDSRWLEAIGEKKYVNPVRIDSPGDQLSLLICHYTFAVTGKEHIIRKAIFAEFSGRITSTYFQSRWIMQVEIKISCMHGSTRAELISFIENGLVT